MGKVLRRKRDYVGRRVKLRYRKRNRFAALPAGTTCTVVSVGGGLHLRSDPCDTCGVQVYIAKVPYQDAELLPRGENDGGPT